MSMVLIVYLSLKKPAHWSNIFPLLKMYYIFRSKVQRQKQDKPLIYEKVRSNKYLQMLDENSSNFRGC